MSNEITRERAAGEVKPGDRVKLRVEGTVTGVGTKWQKKEAVVAVDKVNKAVSR